MRDDGTLRVWLGNGDGSFGAESASGNASNVGDPNLQEMELADINGDGALDAINGAFNSSLRILRGNGAGGFLSSSYFQQVVVGVNGLAVLDVDDDGAPDVVYTSMAATDIMTIRGFRTGTPVVSGAGLSPAVSQFNSFMAAPDSAGGVVFAIVEAARCDGLKRLIFGRNPLAPTSVVSYSAQRQAWGRPSIADFNTGGVGGLANSIVVTDPLLRSLANNGGRTQTIGLGAGSAAVDAGANLYAFDQRGVPRPQLSSSDLGAFEARLTELGLPSVVTPDGSLWFLNSPVGNDRRIYRQAVVAADGATWFFGTDGSGGNFSIYRWTATGTVQSTGKQGVRLGSADGAIVTVTATNELFRRVDSNGGLGSQWFVQTTAFSDDNAGWFIFPSVANETGTVFRFAADGSVTNTGETMSRLSRLGGGTIIARNDGGTLFVRTGSASGVGTGWNELPRVNAADGAARFLGTEDAGPNRDIYRWALAGSPQFAEGNGLTVSTTPARDVRAVNAAQLSFQRIGSNTGLGTEWRLIADSLVVTTIFDENDFTSSANFGNGTSLREAIDFANANPGADTITFSPALIASGQAVQFAFGATGTGDDSAVRVVSDPTINGGGATINYVGSAGRRHFASFTGSTFTLRDLTVSGGITAGVNDGGAVSTSVNLAIENVRFTGNSANGGGALHVFAGRSATITNGQFDSNTATGSGGAIDNAGQLTINGSRFTSNTGGEGGAIQNTGTLDISTSTFANNASGFNGGALRLFGTTTIDRSTFDGITVANEGGAPSANWC